MAAYDAFDLAAVTLLLLLLCLLVFYLVLLLLVQPCVFVTESLSCLAWSAMSQTHNVSCRLLFVQVVLITLVLCNRNTDLDDVP